MEKIIEMKPLTEEQLLQVDKYFATGDLGKYTKSQIWFMYGRMRSKGKRIDKAEAYLKKKEEAEQKEYSSRKNKEILGHLEQYKQDTGGDVGKYEIVKVNNWKTGRTLIIGIMDRYDEQTNKIKRSHTVEIDEWHNPKYFQEMLKHFNFIK